MNVSDEFLRSAKMFHFYAQGSESLEKLRRRFIVDPAEAKLPGSFDVCGDVINVDSLAGANFGCTYGFAVNEGIGFARPYRAGIDALPFWEILVEVVGRFKVSDMDGIGVREQNQAIAFGELFEEA
jgi:hypothetical protein